jgi:hypothetical protein
MREIMLVEGQTLQRSFQVFWCLEAHYIYRIPFGGRQLRYFERFTRFIWILKIWPGTWWSLVEPGLRPPQPPPLCKHNEHNLKLASAIWNTRSLISLIGRQNTNSSKYKIYFTNSSFTFGSKAIPLPLSALELLKPLFTLPFKCHWKVSLRIEHFSQLLCYIYCVLLWLSA